MIYTTLSLVLFATAYALDPIVDPMAIEEVGAEYTDNDVYEAISRAAGSIYATKWSCPIPYTLNANLVIDPTVITNAMAYITSKTGWTFQSRSTEADYIEFFDGSGCWSYLGRVGGKQQISITSGCPFGTVVHEIGHALGITHEQSRPDRDAYIDILTANIIPGRESQFTISTIYNSGDYDFNSVLHYGQWAFTRNGGKTIAPKVPLTDVCYVGQRAVLSADDIIHYNELIDGSACNVPDPEPVCNPDNIKVCGPDTTVYAAASIYREYEIGGTNDGFPYYQSLTPVYTTPMYIYKIAAYNRWFMGTTLGSTLAYAFNDDLGMDITGATNGWYRWSPYSHWTLDPATVVTQVECPTVCVSSCDGVANGDYQSCNGCNVYMTCSNEYEYDNRPCPAGLVWDDALKRCEWESGTCTP